MVTLVHATQTYTYEKAVQYFQLIRSHHLRIGAQQKVLPAIDLAQGPPIHGIETCAKLELIDAVQQQCILA